jgi:Coenzyme PQQ synthesis protein D (PqqD)
MYPRVRPDLTARTVDGEAVLLDRASGRVHQFNQTASFIWSRLDGRTSPRDVATAVAETFDVDPETAGRDVEALLERFRTLNLLAAEAPRGGE